MFSDNLAGMTFGNYRFIKKLGEGYFSEVYLAEHIHLHTPYAIKVLRVTFTMQKDKDAFLAEARMVAKLKHPNIVRVTDFFIIDDRPFLVMDYVPGGSLRSLHLPLPVTTIIPYVHQAASALQYFHDMQDEDTDAKKVGKKVHRDIKPENMLLGARGEVLVSDFGLATTTNSTRYELHDIAGTARYMAPEQGLGKPRRASDQYALAIVVYEWLSGNPPFTEGNFIQLISQHNLSPLPSLCEQVPGLPKSIEDVIFRALAKKPEDRYPTITAFAHALEQASLLPGESFYPPHVALAMRERYYKPYTNPWSGLQANIMATLGQPAEITEEIAKPHTSCHEHRTVGYIRPFERGVICWSKRGGAQHVWYGFNEILQATGGVENYLGFPLNYEERAAPSPQGTIGVFQRFEGRWDYPEGIDTPPVRCGASLYYSEKYRSRPTWGGIGTLYERYQGTAGKLGFPTSAELDAGPSMLGTKGKYQCFEGGFIYWSWKTESHAVWGEIGERYHLEGGTKERLGFPLWDEEEAAESPQGSKGVYQRFEGRSLDEGEAHIYHRHGISGAFHVRGGIGKCYLALGGTRSLLGFPISVEKEATVSPQGTEGWYQDFEGGTLHWTDKYGGIAILGELAKVYSHFDGSGGKFGFPTAPGEAVEGKPNLRTQQFEGGVICIVHEEKHESTIGEVTQ